MPVNNSQEANMSKRDVNDIIKNEFRVKWIQSQRRATLSGYGCKSRPPDVDRNCEYIEKEFGDSRQKAVLQHWIW